MHCVLSWQRDFSSSGYLFSYTECVRGNLRHLVSEVLHEVALADVYMVCITLR